jgi:hypothetical protein
MNPTQEKLNTGARFSSDGTHRFVLWRIWQKGLRKVCFIGLNPSTADADMNDNTIRKLVAICKQQGFGGFYIVNLFTKKATDFDIVKFDSDLNTIQSNYFIWKYALKSDLVCPMWGNKGTWKSRNLEVLSILRDVWNKEIYCFNITGQHQPQHPLMMANDTRFIIWSDPYRDVSPNLRLKMHGKT